MYFENGIWLYDVNQYGLTTVELSNPGENPTTEELESRLAKIIEVFAE
jgi:hypothetical protein